MIYLYYSDSKEKDLVDGWAKYGNKMGFTTIISDMSGWSIVDPSQLETEHRKVKQIIKFKPI